MKKKQKTILAGAVALVVLISGLLGLDPKLLSWNDAYKSAGLSTGSAALDDPLTVHFIDVGQGDCEFIHTDSFNMLIDSGESGNEDTVISYLRNYNVKTLDYVVATHPHSDHIGSMPGIIDAFTVKNVIMPRLAQSNTPTSAEYENFIAAVKKSGAHVYAATPGKTYTSGDISFTVLSPFEQSENLNDMSAAIKLTYKKTSFLFMGDAEASLEKQILDSGENVDCDVIKLGHHGSSTSSSEDFLKAASPQLAVISCGVDNEYGHPHKQTLDRLDALGIEYRRTDKEGTIIAGSDGSRITVTSLGKETEE